jgi:cerevisin
MSIAGPRSAALNNAVKAAFDSGVHIAVAAGNSNSDACSLSPASANDIMVVGSMNSKDEMSGFSNYGPWYENCSCFCCYVGLLSC